MVEPTIGHNSAEMVANTADTARRLASFVQRLERLDEEKRDIAEQMKDVMAEAKGEGFDVRTIREVLKLRRMSEADRTERQELLDVYLNALGMLADMPLGQAAMQRAGVQ